MGGGGRRKNDPKEDVEAKERKEERRESNQLKTNTDRNDLSPSVAQGGDEDGIVDVVTECIRDSCGCISL